MNLFNQDLKSKKILLFYLRLYLIQNSLINYTSTIKNVILGTGLHYFTTWEEQLNAGLGLHSEVIDTLTVYGIIGFTLCFTIVKNYYKKILDNKSKVLFLFIVFYAIFNKIVFSVIGMSIFIVINISQSEDLNEENRTKILDLLKVLAMFFCNHIILFVIGYKLDLNDKKCIKAYGFEIKYIFQLFNNHIKRLSRYQHKLLIIIALFFSIIIPSIGNFVDPLRVLSGDSVVWFAIILFVLNI